MKTKSFLQIYIKKTCKYSKKTGCIRHYFLETCDENWNISTVGKISKKIAESMISHGIPSHN